MFAAHCSFGKFHSNQYIWAKARGAWGSEEEQGEDYVSSRQYVVLILSCRLIVLRNEYCWCIMLGQGGKTRRSIWEERYECKGHEKADKGNIKNSEVRR